MSKDSAIFSGVFPFADVCTDWVAVFAFSFLSSERIECWAFELFVTDSIAEILTLFCPLRGMDGIDCWLSIRIDALSPVRCKFASVPIERCIVFGSNRSEAFAAFVTCCGEVFLITVTEKTQPNCLRISSNFWKWSIGRSCERRCLSKQIIRSFSKILPSHCDPTSTFVTTIMPLLSVPGIVFTSIVRPNLNFPSMFTSAWFRADIVNSKVGWSRW